MHFGKKNANNMYLIDDLCSNTRSPLESSECERDLGIYISSNLKWRNHVEHIATKANRVLGMLVKTFVSRDPNLWKKLYISLVRPHLEFASSCWNPYLQSDIDILEKVQKRASRIPSNMKHLDYEKRLEIWGITTLKDRRIRGDLIQAYKVVHGLEKFNWFSTLEFENDCRTKAATSNSMRLKREGYRNKSAHLNNHCHFVAVRHEFFLNRVTEHWNKLSNSQVQARNINSFKASIDCLSNKAAKACMQAQ